MASWQVPLLLGLFGLSLFGASRWCGSCKLRAAICEAIGFVLLGVGTGASIGRINPFASSFDLQGGSTDSFGDTLSQLFVYCEVSVLGAFSLYYLCYLNTLRCIRSLQIALADLPKQVVVEEFEAEAQGDCSVCLLELADDNGEGLLRLNCGHMFHIGCAQMWLSKTEKPSCPLCRVKVTSFRQCKHLMRQVSVGPVMYLPKTNAHGDTVLLEENRGVWRVQPRSGYPALCCRSTKRLSAKMVERIPRGRIICGVDEGDGWIRCKIPKDMRDDLECGTNVSEDVSAPAAAEVHGEEPQSTSPIVPSPRSIGASSTVTSVSI